MHHAEGKILFRKCTIADLKGTLARRGSSPPAMTGCEEFEIMSVEDMPDERLVRYYENVRQQVEADRAGKHKFMTNPTVHQYADQLRSEMIKRGLEHSPIEWPS
jgi:hypothetical protein